MTEDKVNGVLMSRIPARCAYAFGLRLLDVLFTKEELGSSLLFKTKKSEKPGLDSVKVEQLLRLVERRYGSDYDLKILTSKINQKCRDCAKTIPPHN